MKWTIGALAAGCLVVSGVLLHAQNATAVTAIAEGDASEHGESEEVECWEEDGHRTCVVHKEIHGGRAFLGVQLVPMTAALREHFGAPAEAGVLVSSIVEGSAAENAGFAVGDIITAVDGEAVSTPRELSQKLRALDAGDDATFEIYRENRLEQITATLGERDLKRRAFFFGGEHHPHGEDHEMLRADIHEHIQQALAGIDLEGMREHIHEALQNLEIDLQDIDLDLDEIDIDLQDVEGIGDHHELFFEGESGSLQ